MYYVDLSSFILDDVWNVAVQHIHAKISTANKQRITRNEKMAIGLCVLADAGVLLGSSSGLLLLGMIIMWGWWWGCGGGGGGWW